MLGSAPMVALNITLIAINCWYLFVYTRSARAARLRAATADGHSEASDRQTSR